MLTSLLRRPRVALALTALALAATSCQHQIARRILPGQTLATFVPGQASPKALDQLSLALTYPTPQTELRLRLLNAERKPGQTKPLPGTRDLLPAPLVLLPSQLLDAAHQGELHLSLAAYHLRLPAEGLFLLVECRPVNVAEQVLGISVTEPQRPGEERHTSVVLSTNSDYQDSTRVVPAEQFPALMATLDPDSPSITYLRADSAKGWLHRRSMPVTVNVKVKLAD